MVDDDTDTVIDTDDDMNIIKKILLQLRRRILVFGNLSFWNIITYVTILYFLDKIIISTILIRLDICW